MVAERGQLNDALVAGVILLFFFLAGLGLAAFVHPICLLFSILGVVGMVQVVIEIGIILYNQPDDV